MKKNRYVLLLCICILVPVLVFTGLFICARAAYRAAENDRLAAVLGAGETAGMTDEELLSVMNGAEADHSGKAFMQKYGAYGSDIVFTPAKRFTATALCCLLGCAAVIGLGMFAFAMHRERQRDRDLERLTDYLASVADGNDALKIEENSEEALSRLTNEIYTLTVLLRETANENKKRSAALSESLANISHQIRTPLTSASVMLESIADAPVMDEVQKADFLAEARRQLALISGLCVTLLTLSKFDSGTVELHPVPLTAGDVIDGALQNLAVLLDVRNITVTTHGDKNVCFTADRRWQTEALTNIIKNAAEHSPEGSEIRIETENSGLFVTIRITDEGEGIGEADLPHIFERFYKTKNAGPDSYGVGLSLAKTVIEKDNGTVRVTSMQGVGTTFVISYRLI